VKPLSDQHPFLRSTVIALRRGTPHSLLAAVGLAFLLAACASDEPVPPCPQLHLLKDTDRLVKFVGEGRDLTDVEYETALRDPVLSCEYSGDVLNSVLTVNLVALRGPADDDRLARIAYFVAIVDRNDRVTKEEFDVEIPFEGNRTQVVATEEVEQHIPLQPDETGADYRVFVGLRLTPDELQYNQENR
jgi:hypothetical protein